MCGGRGDRLCWPARRRLHMGGGALPRQGSSVLCEQNIRAGGSPSPVSHCEDLRTRCVKTQIVPVRAPLQAPSRPFVALAECGMPPCRGGHRPWASPQGVPTPAPGEGPLWRPPFRQGGQLVWTAAEAQRRGHGCRCPASGGRGWAVGNPPASSPNRSWEVIQHVPPS